jgi:hypothetical protein
VWGHQGTSFLLQLPSSPWLSTWATCGSYVAACKDQVRDPPTELPGRTGGWGRARVSGCVGSLGKSRHASRVRSTHPGECNGRAELRTTGPQCQIPKK